MSAGSEERAGEGADRRLVGKDENEFRILILESAAHDMFGLLSVVRKRSVVITEMELRGFLERYGVFHGIQDEVLAEAVTRCAEGENVVRTVVARGTDAVDGLDAKIDWQKRPTGKRLSTEALAEGEQNIDFKELTSFENVLEGEVIGTFVPPQEGHAGADIFDRVIPCKDSVGMDVRLGKNVAYDEETREYRALCKGHVTFEHHLLDVSPVYEVHTCVDLRQGHIRFVGRVEIGEDVFDDFVVSGDEGLLVRGVAEGCRLVSGADLVVLGGVKGKGRGHLETKGALFARFLNECEAVVAGDVVVDREIVNSRIYALGRILVPNGVIVGGEVVALRGVVAGEIGSELGVNTKVTAGIDYHVAAELLDVNAKANRARERRQEVLQVLGPLLERALKAAAVDAAQHDQIESLWSEVRALQKRVSRLERESGSLSQSFQDQAVERLEVQKVLHPGATLVVGSYDRSYTSALRGPLSVVPDETHECLTFATGHQAPALLDALPRPPKWAKP